MTPRIKVKPKKRFKAWAIVNKTDDSYIQVPVGGHMWIFDKRDDALNEIKSRFYNGNKPKDIYEKVVPCEIVYQLPKRKA